MKLTKFLRALKALPRLIDSALGSYVDLKHAYENESDRGLVLVMSEDVFNHLRHTAERRVLENTNDEAFSKFLFDPDKVGLEIMTN